MTEKYDYKSEITEGIRLMVRSGFYGLDQIVEMVSQMRYSPELLDKEWIKSVAQPELERKQQEEKTWEATTDCDRLDSVFSKLRENRIIALHNAGDDQTEGKRMVIQRWEKAGGKKFSNIMGYCYYHGADMDRAIAGKGLFLAFGNIHENQKQGIEVGEMIKKELENAGLKVEWDGTLDRRMKLPDIVWRRRGTGTE